LPPEDCGGPWGYASLLAAIADPEGAGDNELLEWVEMTSIPKPSTRWR